MNSGSEEEGSILSSGCLSGNQLLAPAELWASRHDNDDQGEESGDELEHKTNGDHNTRKKGKVTQTTEKIKWV